MIGTEVIDASCDIHAGIQSRKGSCDLPRAAHQRGKAGPEGGIESFQERGVEHV